MVKQELVFDDGRTRLSMISRPEISNRKLLISFTGVGHAMGGMDVQNPEFFATGKAYETIVFISDLQRSWGNALDFDRIAEVIRSLPLEGKADAIGNSMGGFLALLAPSLLPVGNVMAFVPQFSVHPDFVPWENRWPKYCKGISEWRFPSLEGRIVKDCTYHIAPGSHPLDVRHADMLPMQDNVVRINLPDFEHRVAAQLKAAGVLQELIARCFDGSFSQSWLDAALLGAPGQAPEKRPSLFRRLMRGTRFGERNPTQRRN